MFIILLLLLLFMFGPENDFLGFSTQVFYVLPNMFIKSKYRCTFEKQWEKRHGYQSYKPAANFGVEGRIILYRTGGWNNEWPQLKIGQACGRHEGGGGGGEIKFP
jgi:hypothetical protein